MYPTSPSTIWWPAYRILDARARTTKAKAAMTQGFPPATKATMMVTRARSRHMPVTGGMSPSFRVVFLLILLLEFFLLIGLLSA